MGEVAGHHVQWCGDYRRCKEPFDSQVGLPLDDVNVKVYDDYNKADVG